METEDIVGILNETNEEQFFEVMGKFFVGNKVHLIGELLILCSKELAEWRINVIRSRNTEMYKSVKEFIYSFSGRKKLGRGDIAVLTRALQQIPDIMSAADYEPPAFFMTLMLFRYSVEYHSDIREEISTLCSDIDYILDKREKKKREIR